MDNSFFAPQARWEPVLSRRLASSFLDLLGRVFARAAIGAAFRGFFPPCRGKFHFARREPLLLASTSVPLPSELCEPPERPPACESGKFIGRGRTGSSFRSRGRILHL